MNFAMGTLSDYLAVCSAVYSTAYREAHRKPTEILRGILCEESIRNLDLIQKTTKNFDEMISLPGFFLVVF